MLIYHPAFDLHHGVFRLLRLLEENPSHELAWDAYRILDFYYLFPHFLANVTLPSALLGRKRALRRYESKYARVPSPRAFVQQMAGSHETIARSLIGKGFLDAEAYESRRLSRTNRPIPSALEQTFSVAVDDAELVRLLAVDLAELPLSGRGGLKERTGLLEHRYDPV